MSSSPKSYLGTHAQKNMIDKTFLIQLKGSIV